MGMTRPATPSLARSRRAPRAHGPPIILRGCPASSFSAILLHRWVGAAAGSRLPSAASRPHPPPAAASARLAGAVRVHLTGPAHFEPPASPLALAGASGVEGGGKHPSACGSALRGDAGRESRAGAGAAAGPGPVRWEAGLGRARGSRAAESPDCREWGSCGWGPGGGSGGLGERAVGWALGEEAALGTEGLRSPGWQGLARSARLGVPGLVVKAIVCRRTWPAREWPWSGDLPVQARQCTASVSKWGDGTECCHTSGCLGGSCLYHWDARVDAQFPFQSAAFHLYLAGFFADKQAQQHLLYLMPSMT